MCLFEVIIDSGLVLFDLSYFFKVVGFRDGGF